MNDDQDNLTVRAGELTKSVETLNTSVGHLREYSRRSRRLIWLTAVGLTLDLALSIALVFVAVQANNASNRATEATSSAAQNRQNARIACEVGNQARVVQIQLWTYVLDLAKKSPNQTPAQQQQIAQFRVYLQEVFAPRNCADPASPTVQSPTTSPTR